MDPGFARISRLLHLPEYPRIYTKITLWRRIKKTHYGRSLWSSNFIVVVTLLICVLMLWFYSLAVIRMEFTMCEIRINWLDLTWLHYNVIITYITNQRCNVRNSIIPGDTPWEVGGKEHIDGHTLTKLCDNFYYLSKQNIHIPT